MELIYKKKKNWYEIYTNKIYIYIAKLGWVLAVLKNLIYYFNS